MLLEKKPNSKFFANKNQNTLINKIEGVFQHKDIHYFDALVGYFRASGYFRIRPFVEKCTNCCIESGLFSSFSLEADASVEGD